MKASVYIGSCKNPSIGIGIILIGDELKTENGKTYIHVLKRDGMLWKVYCNGGEWIEVYDAIETEIDVAE